MFRFWSLILFIFSSFIIFSQVEIITPLETNFNGVVKNQINKRSYLIDSTITFTSDTLTIETPLVEDFSVSHFQKYPSNIDYTKLSKSVFYKILKKVDNKPLMNTSNYSLTKSYIKKHDIVTKKDTAVLQIPLLVKIASFSSVPIQYQDAILYPTYTIFDTLGIENKKDTLFSIASDLVQDSVTLFSGHIKDKNSYWLDSSVYRNYTFAINPWTLGVVTFDGLNANGYPYNINSSTRGYGDYLTSKPFDLSKVKVKDSVYFSFLFQPKGYGDAPENTIVGSIFQQDSLCLQFYNSTTKKWVSVWGSTVSDDPDVFKKQSESFQKVHLKLNDSTFFTSNFQFRFTNYGDLSGSLDHFHLDYIKFRKNSGYQDTLFKDFAFVYPIGSILKEYTSVPWDHYIVSKLGRINDSIKIVVRNSSNSPENTMDGKLTIRYKTNEVGTIDLLGQKIAGNNLNYAPLSTIVSYHSFANGYELSTDAQDLEGSYEVKAAVSAPFTNLLLNDTSTTNLSFKDFYAYDDGSAEVAYGLKSSQARLAYKFNPYVSTDSLVGVSISFVPSVVDKSSKLFSLAICESQNGLPGKVLYQDDDISPRQPVYGKFRNAFETYYLKDFQRLPITGEFFIVIKQSDQDPLNIGFDRNTIIDSKLMFSSDNSNWSHSAYEGALMVRPVFQTRINKTLSINEQAKISPLAFHPNPTTDKVFISNKTTDFKGVELFTMDGKKLANYGQNINEFSLEEYPIGIILVREISNGKIHKIVKI